MAQSLTKRFRHWLTFTLANTLIVFFNVISRRLALFIGSWLGLTAWSLLPRDRHRIRRHLTLAWGNRVTERERSRLGRSFFVNSGKNLVDIIRFRRHYHSELKPLIECQGLEHWDEAYRKGRGVIGVTGHIGNFELLAVYLQSLEPYDIAVVGREMYDKRMDRLLVENRQAMGLTNIATTDSPRRFLQWLRDGKAMGVLIDTDSFRVRSMFIPAFGRLSNTPVGQTLIGLKAGSAFVPGACVRLPDDRYRVVFKAAIEYPPTGDSERDVYEITLRCTRALEEIISEYPDQWIWLHNRWHTRP